MTLSPWRGSFEPSTAPFRLERELVRTVSTQAAAEYRSEP